MWKRDAAVKPANGQPGTPGGPNQQVPTQWSRWIRIGMASEMW